MLLKIALSVVAIGMGQAALAGQEACTNWLDGTFWQSAASSDVAECLAGEIAVNGRTSHGETPLHLAVEHGRSPAILRMLLERGADPDLTDEKGRTPLHVAAESAVDAAVPVTLLAWGADVEAALPGDTCEWPRRLCATRPLHLAAGRSDGIDIAAALIVAGADPDAEDEAGNRPLHLAASIGATEAVRLLLQAGATHDASDFDGETALHAAARQPEDVIQVISLLLERGLSPDTPDDDEGVTPLILGTRYSTEPAAVHLLLKASETPCYADEKGRAALMMWDDNDRLARDDSYWALHEECLKAE
ncbi:ankyrin repeat domain-containing protein [Tranquillimonas alkanivorans]|uniref:Ankyrin repeat-containing protein n=1 Tax=Tranquillimonas alkanivorans TaxID=441119 RepID=A0A1I5PBH8_9RHOB|nr:ankyrin repeat domain-containing protein [Tranquillimonas alkanivorans]SFP31333.1 Ankyrin repeat-containing protein [Tranquillimonas alkanivorans]